MLESFMIYMPNAIENEISRNSMKNKRVLFIAPLPPPITGQAVACEALYAHLQKKGYEVILIDLSKKDFTQGVGSLARCLEVIKIFSQIFFNVKKTDIIYMTPAESVAGNLKDIVIYLLCYAKLRSMIIHLHGGAGMRKILSSKNLFLKCINAFFLKKIGASIVLGSRLRDIYVDLVDSRKIYAIENFSNSQYFVSQSDVEEKFSHFNPLKILFLSNHLPGKGHEELLSALQLLTEQERACVQMDFAGGFESPNSEEAFRLKVSNIKGGEINVHGTVRGEAKKNLLKNAHLFCLPTYYPYEGQPISILEAYASACAVLTTDHSGIFDIFTPDVNGIAVEKKSPESIAVAIRFALAQHARVYEYAKQNIVRAEENYRIEKHLNAIEDVFLNLSKS